MIIHNNFKFLNSDTKIIIKAEFFEESCTIQKLLNLYYLSKVIVCGSVLLSWDTPLKRFVFLQFVAPQSVS